MSKHVDERGLVTYRVTENCVFADLNQSGKLSLYVYFSAFCGIDASMWEAIEAWTDDSEADTALEVRFSLADALDMLLDSNMYGDKVDASEKPVIDAMRSELLQMVARIDALKYTEE